MVRLVLSAVEEVPARTILVADDEPGIRALLRTSLERHGLRVLEANSAAEIFEILDQRRPDVLLLDIRLGPDDGLAIGTGIRQEREHSALKVVFMTGEPDRGDLFRLSHLWNVPILLKPFNVDELLDAIS
jgi:DNA-binding response OmpR family regulator